MVEMLAYIYPFLTSNLTLLSARFIYIYYSTTPEHNHNDYIRDLVTNILTCVKHATLLQVYDIKLYIFEEKLIFASVLIRK